MPWYHIALSTPLEVGQKTAKEIEGKDVLICRLNEDYYAVANRCTHAAWRLSEESIAGMEIVCSLHGARFDLRDGCPTSGPATKPLATYPVELRNGELYVSL
ncbi:MAG: non-heme iron oxygenase ferredoxin subunit [Myxococcales bacterium]|nr:non-heme iron oxygenase ferredoxin subunit [Myxococcales bacterium]HIK86262.1 non-heme iron oxygenase ferredoxin subunit [Myxococcales bacterium]